MIYYEITKEDILKPTKKMGSKVLQYKYNTPYREAIDLSFYTFMKKIKIKVIDNSITILEANEQIYQKVKELTIKYPNDFPDKDDLGWYSKQLLVEKYLSGKVTIIED